MYGYVYITTNLINGKTYLGQHKSESYDSNYLGSGKLIRQAFQIYGFSNFSSRILVKCLSEESLNYFEELIIKNTDAVSDKNYYNLIPGGSPTDLNLVGMMHSKEAIDKAKNTRILRYGSPEGLLNTPDTIKKKLLTYKRRYGNLMVFCHTDKANKKRNDTNTSRYGSPMGATLKYANKRESNRLKSVKRHYNGDAGGMFHTDKARKKSFDTKIKKYGSINARMETSEAIEKRKKSKRHYYNENTRRFSILDKVPRVYTIDNFSTDDLRSMRDHIKYSDEKYSKFSLEVLRLLLIGRVSHRYPLLNNKIIISPVPKFW